MHLCLASKKLHTYLVAFGIFSCALNIDAAERGPDSLELTKEEIGEYVIVEPSNRLVSSNGEGEILLPYKQRRKDWGWIVGIGVGSYEPINYEPDQFQGNFEDIYDNAPTIPMAEIHAAYKRNFSLASVGLDMGVGFYQTESSGELIDSKLTLVPIRLGARIALDTLFGEPYVVPYVTGGTYLMIYDEDSAETNVNGNTSFAAYAAGGILISMNWVDPYSSWVSYVESGIENTFIFLEARKFFASDIERDPDFETDVHVDGGLKIEF